MSDSRTKKCPQCQNEMGISVKVGVEIDFCTPCSVVWLDRGELNHICDRSSVVTQAMKQLMGSAAKKSSYSCPTCFDKKLSTATVVGASLSVCQGCQGLLLNAATLRWFRKKALAKQHEHDRNTPHLPKGGSDLVGVPFLETLATFTFDVLASFLIH